MAPYLTKTFMQSALNRGKSIEQFLGGFPSQEGPAIRYLIISPQNNGLFLRLYESLDVGDMQYIDIYSFPDLDQDLEQGEPVASHFCDNLEDVLSLAVEHYSADLERFVNQGVSQEDYVDYLHDRGTV